MNGKTVNYIRNVRTGEVIFEDVPDTMPPTPAWEWVSWKLHTHPDVGTVGRHDDPQRLIMAAVRARLISQDTAAYFLSMNSIPMPIISKAKEVLYDKSGCHHKMRLSQFASHLNEHRNQHEES